MSTQEEREQQKNAKLKKKNRSGCGIILLILVICLAVYCNRPSEEDIIFERKQITEDSLMLVEKQLADSLGRIPLKQQVYDIYLDLKSNPDIPSAFIGDFKRMQTKTKGTEYEDKVAKTLDSLSLAKLKALTIFEIKERKDWETKLRNSFLDNNLDIKVMVHGENNTSITFTYILFNDIWFRKFETEGHFSNLYRKGFKRITLTDGYRYNKYITYK